MDKLIIDNFITIKHAEIDVNDFTVIIGPQSTGKSLIAKLVYYFRSLLNDVIQTAFFNENLDYFKNNSRTKFNNIFNVRNFKNFKISFSFNSDSETDNSFIVINSNGNLRLKYSSSLKTIFEKIFENSKIIQEKGFTYYSFLRDSLLRDINDAFKNTVFTPATRSFYTVGSGLITTNSLDTTDLINFFFLSNVDNARKEYTKTYDHRIYLQLIITKILSGEIIANKKEIKFYSNALKKKFNIKDTSSGTQELIPLILLLICNIESYFIIEEPESHIYPETQYYLTRLLSYIMIERNNFFVTTHSPYILTALNNLILLDNVIKQIEDSKLSNYEKTQKREKIKKRTGDGDDYFDEKLPFECVSAYEINNGEVKSIKDEKNKLIIAENIDSASDKISEDFSFLLDIMDEITDGK